MGTRDSLGALISVCAPVGRAGNGELDERSSGLKRTILSSVDAIIEGEECVGQQSEKKKRLSVLQVRSLEKNFEIENKLEPDRKIQLAQELGLQPRQVAVWFQNRRARWKTKQLERDYGLLKANYDHLKSSYHSLQQDKDNLAAELAGLKEKLKEAEKRKAGELMVIDAPLLGGKDGHGEDDIDIKPLNRIVLSKEKDDRADIKLLMSNEAVMQQQDGSESDSSAVLNDNSPHPIDNRTSSPILINSTTGCDVAAAVSATADGNTERGLMQIAEAVSSNARGLPPKAIYQQFFRMDDSFESCGSFFANADHHSAATLPWWESWP